MLISERISSSISRSLGIDAKKFFVESVKSELGDYSSSVLMQEAFKNDKQKYFDIIKSDLEKIRYVKKVSLDGGFINVFLDPVYSINHMDKITKIKKNYMVEFSSPNSNKPLHLGHIRNTVLGDTLSNMLMQKYDVVKANLINDRGVHICKSMLGYKMFLSKEFNSPKEAQKKSDKFVGDCYVAFSKAEKENEALSQKAEDMLLLWENGDKETYELWEKMNGWAIGGIKQTYKRLGVGFDTYFYESKIYKKGKKIVFDAYNEGIVQKDENGNYIVDLTDINLDKKVVLRSNGTSVYITQDLYLAQLKFDKYNLDHSIYCIGSEQGSQMQQLFEILKRFGYNHSKDMEHFSYGMVYLPDGKMKSREGTVVDADDFIDQVEAKVREVLVQKEPSIGQKELIKRSKSIALMAIKYFILKYDPKRDFIYEFDKSLSFEGNSGPYIMYVYARINSLIKKINRKHIKMNSKINTFYTDEEQDIARKLVKYNYKLDSAIERRAPHLMINYITEISNSFNSLYAKHKLITTKVQMRNRLYILNKLKSLYEDFFNLIGIKPLDRM